MDPEPTSLLITLSVDNVSLVMSIILLFILLLCSALISGAEVALFSLTRSDLNSGLEENSKQIQIISKLLERPKKLLAPIIL